MSKIEQVLNEYRPTNLPEVNTRFREAVAAGTTGGDGPLKHPPKKTDWTPVKNKHGGTETGVLKHRSGEYFYHPPRSGKPHGGAKTGAHSGRLFYSPKGSDEDSAQLIAKGTAGHPLGVSHASAAVLDHRLDPAGRSKTPRRPKASGVGKGPHSPEPAWAKNKKFTNPKTKRKVLFKSLPPEEQKKLRKQYDKPQGKDVANKNHWTTSPNANGSGSDSKHFVTPHGKYSYHPETDTHYGEVRYHPKNKSGAGFHKTGKTVLDKLEGSKAWAQAHKFAGEHHAKQSKGWNAPGASNDPSKEVPDTQESSKSGRLKWSKDKDHPTHQLPRGHQVQTSHGLYHWSPKGGGEIKYTSKKKGTPMSEPGFAEWGASGSSAKAMKDIKYHDDLMSGRLPPGSLPSRTYYTNVGKTPPTSKTPGGGPTKGEKAPAVKTPKQDRDHQHKWQRHEKGHLVSKTPIGQWTIKKNPHPELSGGRKYLMQPGAGQSAYAIRSLQAAKDIAQKEYPKHHDEVMEDRAFRAKNKAPAAKTPAVEETPGTGYTGDWADRRTKNRKPLPRSRR